MVVKLKTPSVAVCAIAYKDNVENNIKQLFYFHYLLCIIMDYSVTLMCVGE